MNNYSRVLVRFSALFAVIGAFLGAHMVSSESFLFRPVHAHILTIGWLSLFAWAVYYKVFHPKESMLAKLHVYTAIIGASGVSIGMWFYYLKPFYLPNILILTVYIGGGAVLLLSFIFFSLLTISDLEGNL